MRVRVRKKYCRGNGRVTVAGVADVEGGGAGKRGKK